MAARRSSELYRQEAERCQALLPKGPRVQSPGRASPASRRPTRIWRARSRSSKSTATSRPPIRSDPNAPPVPHRRHREDLRHLACYRLPGARATRRRLSLAHVEQHRARGRTNIAAPGACCGRAVLRFAPRKSDRPRSASGGRIKREKKAKAGVSRGLGPGELRVGASRNSSVEARAGQTDPREQLAASADGPRLGCAFRRPRMRSPDSVMGGATRRPARWMGRTAEAVSLRPGIAGSRIARRRAQPARTAPSRRPAPGGKGKATRPRAGRLAQAGGREIGRAATIAGAL